LDRADPMDALAAALAQLRPGAREPANASAIIGAFPVLLGAWARGRQGAAPLSPDPHARPAMDALRLLHGRGPIQAEADALDAYWVTVIDHGLNASTFAARVVASTGSDLTSSVLAALGALKGPLHGGAPGPVLDMLDAIATPGRARAWLAGELDAGRRIMGMGHRVYRVRDPRAAALENALRSLDGESPRLALARAVEREAEAVLAERKPERRLRANVEMATATLLEGLAIPREAFTALFACSRIAGWCAHAREQRATGRLLRPRARYVGPRPADQRASA
ncbi:MAG: citrate/2-methylcitrate synthase, partial [Myxococcota bacterium]